MDRVRWIEHDGKHILFEDVSDLQDAADICAISDASTGLIRKQPKSSVIMSTNATGARYSPSVVNGLKGNTKLANPYMKAYAVLGITGLTGVVLKSVVRFTGQDAKACSNLEEARRWLDRQ